ncbi:MAG TPA: endonuclease VII domain-containing protein [Thermoanaerobaculia bacterium]
MSAEERATIEAQNASATSIAEIARIVGRNPNVVLAYLQRAGLWMRQRNAPPPSARPSRGSHLGPDEVERFKIAVRNGVTYERIAETFCFDDGKSARLFAKEIGVLETRLARQDKNGSTRRCSRCKHVKDLAHFAKQVDKHGNYLCHPCHRLVMVKHVYGISEDELTAMLERQDHRCAICRRLPWERATRGSTRRKNLAIDHDHRSGKIRGLLCSSCNKGLGLFREQPARMAAAIEYLNIVSEVHRGTSSSGDLAF